MKKFILSLLFTAVCIGRVWAGDEPPTVESNKNLIDLVQSHADYVWTLVAAALVFFMQAGFFLSDFKVGGDPWVLAFWMFQVVFCATAATIVSGAMAERTKFAGYLIYSVVLSAIISVQLLGIAACFLWVFPVAFLMFKLIEKTIGLRVSPEEELEGLDVSEHGGNAYPDFEVYSYGTVGSGGGSATAAALGSPGQVDLEPVEQT
jgi:ammonia channel protein AmtB